MDIDKFFNEEIDDQDQTDTLKQEFDEYQTEKIEEYYSENCNNSETLPEYLVDGAILQCNRATLEQKKVGTRECKAINGLKITKLQVGEKKRKATANGLGYANIYDTIINDNLKAFRCNCEIPPDNDTEINNIEKNEDCETVGNCKYLINLNSEWYNLPSNEARENESFEDKNGEKQIGIDMGSSLFCKHGGLITPIKSGQIIAIDIPVPSNDAPDEIKINYIWSFLLAQGLSEECVAGILGNIFQESKLNTEANRNNNFHGLFQLENPRWNEYKKWLEGKDYENEYSIDAQCAYMLYEFQGINDERILLKNSSCSEDLLCTYESFCSAKSPKEAALIFATAYERCVKGTAKENEDKSIEISDIQERENRITYAQVYYREYKKRNERIK